MLFQTKVKSWGSSLGVVVPSEIIRQEQIKAGDDVFFDIRKKSTMDNVFGRLKEWKIDSQKFKDKTREEWS